MSANAFSRELDRLMTERRYSGEEVAALLTAQGLPRTRSAVNYWRAGSTPKRDVVEALQLVLEVEDDSLMAAAGYRSENVSDVVRLQAEVDQLRAEFDEIKGMLTQLLSLMSEAAPVQT